MAVVDHPALETTGVYFTVGTTSGRLHKKAGYFDLRELMLYPDEYLFFTHNKINK